MISHILTFPQLACFFSFSLFLSLLIFFFKFFFIRINCVFLWTVQLRQRNKVRCCEPITEPKKEAVNTQLNKLPMISKLAVLHSVSVEGWHIYSSCNLLKDCLQVEKKQLDLIDKFFMVLPFVYRPSLLLVYPRASLCLFKGPHHCSTETLFFLSSLIKLLGIQTEADNNTNTMIKVAGVPLFF